MADKPILFSAPMVRALLEGRKTQTRRALNPQPIQSYAGDTPYFTWGKITGLWPDDWQYAIERNVRVMVGDRLYVREHWRVSQKWDRTAPRDLPAQTMTVFFNAGGSIANQASGRWEPDNAYPARRPDWVGKHRQAMHMPRWASRITLIVTDVRVERLQDISEADAVAEGATRRQNTTGDALDRDGWSMDWSEACPGGPLEIDIALTAPRAAFLNYFHKVNATASKFGDDVTKWPNPWIVAYTFTVHHQNIDTMEAAA